MPNRWGGACADAPPPRRVGAPFIRVQKKVSRINGPPTRPKAIFFLSDIFAVVTSYLRTKNWIWVGPVYSAQKSTQQMGFEQKLKGFQLKKNRKWGGPRLLGTLSNLTWVRTGPPGMKGPPFIRGGLYSAQKSTLKSWALPWISKLVLRALTFRVPKKCFFPVIFPEKMEKNTKCMGRKKW